MRKIVLYGVIIFQILLIISLIRGIQLSRKSNERIEALTLEKAKLVEQSEKLKQEREYVNSPYYLEKVARDELNLGKPGERVVIISEDLRTWDSANQKRNELVVDVRPNWQKWWGVMSGGR